ncbi:MAG TPA: hypothetical protein PKM63_15435 [Panacibacter sp.]|nr:hypothetical protein [Panacibacter sp.]HNP45683.1 hypothetical protein [Panacibacter sp.]
MQLNFLFLYSHRNEENKFKQSLVVAYKLRSGLVMAQPLMNNHIQEASI